MPQREHTNIYITINTYVYAYKVILMQNPSEFMTVNRKRKHIENIWLFQISQIS